MRFFVFLFIFSTLITSVNALGIASDYLENNTMLLKKGESRLYGVRIQNLDLSADSGRFVLNSKVAEMIDYKEVYEFSEEQRIISLTINITAPNKLDEAEVERMRKQAEEFGEQDKKRKEEIETVNQADAFVYSTEKQLKEFEGKVEAKELDSLKPKIDEIKKLLAAEQKDVAALKTKLEETQKLMHGISSKLYAKAQAAQQAAQASTKDTAKKQEKTIEGEKA